MHVFHRHLHKSDDGFLLLLKDLDQLAYARGFGIDEIIGKQDGKRFIAHQIASAENGRIPPIA